MNEPTGLEGLRELNFAPVAKSIEEYPEQQHCHWLLRAAVDMPGMMQEWTDEEGSRKITYRAYYDPDTKVMHTNYPGCPRSNHHHLYQTCGVCGQHG